MVIAYAGTGTDPEDGTLPASAFTWRVDFHHDTHVHPFIAPTTGARSGSFTIPTSGETSANVWYRIYLTVQDSDGLTQTTQRDILPRKSRLTLATNPAGPSAQARWPAGRDAVVLRQRRRDRPDDRGDDAADGGRARPTPSTPGRTAAPPSHSISTPAANTTYTATYRADRWRRQRPDRRVLRHADPHRQFDHADRSDCGLRLGRRVAGAGHSGRPLQRALDRPGDAAVLRDLPVLYRQQRRRAAVDQRDPDREQLDQPRHHREQRHDRADRRPTLRHPDGVLRGHGQRDGAAAVEQPVDAESGRPVRAPLHARPLPRRPSSGSISRRPARPCRPGT